MSDASGPQSARQTDDRTAANMRGAGGLLIFVSVALGYLAGKDGRKALDSDYPFDWALAALVFTPLFVAGIVLISAAAIIRHLR